MKLVKYKDAPSYMLYDHVHNYYRVGGTYYDCINSIFHLHTETLIFGL